MPRIAKTRFSSNEPLNETLDEMIASFADQTFTTRECKILQDAKFLREQPYKIVYDRLIVLKEYLAIKDWLTENITGNFEIMLNTIIWFENEADAVAFKLRWF